MKLVNKTVREKLPTLYLQEPEKDAVAHVKFFTPWSNWTWYASEFYGKDTFFGLIQGFDKELGYFSLSELESARGPGGLRIERDLSFVPTALSELR